MFVGLASGMLSACGGDSDSGTDPTEGSIQVTANTTGSQPDPDGYSVAVDGGTAQALPINGSATFSSLAPGDHSVGLSGLASNCTVEGDNPRSAQVTAGETAEVTFGVSCGSSSGSIIITAATTGFDLDGDGYSVELDGVVAGDLAVNGTLTLSEVPPGVHEVLLTEVAANCTVVGDNPRSATVPDAGTPEVTVDFEVTCEAPGGTIAFWSSRDGDNEDIYVVNPDGTGLTPLTNTAFPEQSFDPDWSPDGASIVFWSNRAGAGAGTDVWVMDADGSNPQPLTSDDETSQDPAWSPDGNKIAYAKDLQIFVMDADGSNSAPVGSDPGGAHSPSWSPDGNRITFVSLRDGNPEIYVMDSDGSNAFRLTNTTAEERTPDWSPDGTAIVFATDRDGDFEIYRMDPDGSNPTNLTQDPATDLSPAWSPDGGALAFASDRESSVNLWRMAADGSGPTQVTTGTLFQRDDGPAWSP